MIKLTWSWDIAYVVEIETSEHLVLFSSWMAKIILTLATLQSYIKSFPNLRYSKKINGAKNQGKNTQSFASLVYIQTLLLFFSIWFDISSCIRGGKNKNVFCIHQYRIDNQFQPWWQIALHLLNSYP